MSETEMAALLASLPPSNPALADHPYFNRRFNATEEEEGLLEEHFYSL